MNILSSMSPSIEMPLRRSSQGSSRKMFHSLKPCFIRLARMLSSYKIEAGFDFIVLVASTCFPTCLWRMNHSYEYLSKSRGLEFCFSKNNLFCLQFPILLLSLSHLHYPLLYSSYNIKFAGPTCWLSIDKLMGTLLHFTLNWSTYYQSPKTYALTNSHQVV